MDIITMNSARVFIVKGSVRRYHEIKGGFPMAILFSKATLASGGSSTSFLIAGAPSSVEEFDGWTAYHSFIEGLPAGTEVQVRITAYTSVHLHKQITVIGSGAFEGCSALKCIDGTLHELFNAM